ncbi:hypothetical protein V2J09_001162 [Rumex salicifolius]
MSSTGGDLGSQSSSSSRNSKKPIYSKFTQQELPAYKPILTPVLTVVLFVILGVIFIPIGYVSLNASDDVVEFIYRYDHNCVPPSYNKNLVAYIQNSDINKTCIATLSVTKKMIAPVYIYYQLDNFHQNHRRYVKSRNANQLKSASKSNETTNCSPEDKTEDDGSPIVPCGMVAWSLFNDTYTFSIANSSLSVIKKGIAWASDVNHKFGADVYPKNFQSGGLIGGAQLDDLKPLREQEDLIVWMRPAALPIFRKLYGKIGSDLQPGQNISVVIQNNYNTYSFGGKKKLVLSTTSWIGGKNVALGVSYLAVGGACLFLAFCFVVMFFFKPRKLGDPSYLSWNRSPESKRNIACRPKTSISTIALESFKETYVTVIFLN